MPAHRIPHDGVVFRLDGELCGMFRDVPYRPADVLQRGVIPCIRPDAVAQHEDGIPHFVQLPRSARPFFQLSALVPAAAGDDEGILRARLLGREIEQCRLRLGGVLRDLIHCVEQVGHLDACVVIFDDEVHAVGAALGHIAVGVLFQRGSFPTGAGPAGSPYPANRYKSRSPRCWGSPAVLSWWSAG